MSFDHRDPGTPEAAWRNGVRWNEVPVRPLDHVDRAVVLAAHPDDETLGAGGVVHRLASQGTQLRIIVATLGENSHPDSPTHTPEALARRREAEMSAATRQLTGGRAEPEYLGLRDGALTDEALEPAVTEAVDWAAQGQEPLVIAPWEGDGHTDHEALGRTCARLTAARGIPYLQYPVWLWHWGDPAELPDGMVRVPLSERDLWAKKHALAHHASQVEPLSEHPGDEVLLGAHVVEHFLRPAEAYVQGTPHQGVVFDRVHTRSRDPWHVDHSPYERRKREVLLASLPRQRFGTALDIGCSTGALTAELSHRAGRVVAVDASSVALDRARERFTAGRGGNVTLVHALLPQEWDPQWQDLDLVVVSEVGYFCSPAQWRTLLDRCVAALAEHGTLVLCHWRHPIRGWPLDGADVHRTAREHPGLERVLLHTERDVDLEMFSRPGQGRG